MTPFFNNLSTFIPLLTLFFTSLICTVNANNPPDLKSVLKPGARVFRAVTTGELQYISGYVKGQQPPPYIEISSDFAKYGAFYTFATPEEAIDWGLSLSGYHHQKPSDFIKHKEWIHKFFIVELEYDPKNLKPTHKFFAKGGPEYTEFIKSNYPPPGTGPDPFSMQWPGPPTPAVADIIEGPMSNSLKFQNQPGKEPHLLNPGTPEVRYNHQIAFASEKAMQCLKVVHIMSEKDFPYEPATAERPASCCTQQ
ncbi:hypothetical protein CVT24_001810 [Panaeolus cyanescens]|uniref:Uncharacterized protein n=1 Tax=Panaeolus cyanescens TaxID=181874 RepID=A0A409YFI4_9AGAR|nr:hypothetical protein CVT24_001810 [Panaeolus cyanescens]